jgi:hypothetical protein
MLNSRTSESDRNLMEVQPLADRFLRNGGSYKGHAA